MPEQSLPAIDLPETAELAIEIAGYLVDGRSVHVTGLPGSGRSHLLRRVQDELGMTGWHVLHVRGSYATDDRALAALALAGVGVDAIPQQATGGTPIVRAAEALEKLLARPQVMLMVDDAAQLDRLSAGVIAAVRSRRDFPFLFASRPVASPGGPLDTLVAAAQPGVEVVLGTLRLGQIHQLVHDLLPGVVEPGAIAQLAALSGGLPGLLRAIVDTAARSGRLRLEENVWRAQGDLWSDRLGLALRPFLAGLDPSDVDVLTRLARAGAVTAESAGELADVDLLGRFARSGLLRSDKGFPESGMYVYPPALAELLRRTSAPGAGPETTEHPSGVLRGGWRSHLLVGADAAAFAERVLEHWHSQAAIHWEAWKADPSPLTAVKLLAAMRASGASGDEIEAVLQGTRRDKTDPTAFARLVTWEAIYAAGPGRSLQRARELLEAARTEVPHLDAYLRTYEAHLVLVHDRVPERRLIVPAKKSEDALGAEAVAGVQVEALLARGQTTEAAALLASYSPVHPREIAIHRLFSGLVQVLGDDVRGGVEWALDGFSDAMDALDAGMMSAHAYVAALGMSMLGTFDELDALVEVAFRLTGAEPLQGHYRAGLFQVAAVVAGWEGRADYARSLAAQALSFGAGDGPFPGMLESLGMLEDPDHSPDQIWDIVDDRLARDYLATAVFFAVRAVEEDPSTKRADLVVKLGTASQSRVIRTMAGYIAAVVSHDIAGLENAIDELREYCGPLHAVRARITRALLMREDEDFDGWLAQADAAWREGDGLGHRCVGLFGRILRAVSLTQREEEVVALAAQGRSAVEISELTDTTRRTAETHIQTAYRKIGVRNRQELRHAIATWLTL